MTTGSDKRRLNLLLKDDVNYFKELKLKPSELHDVVS